MMTPSSKTLKCNSCNIVISEVLAFIQHKGEVMTEESMIQICSTAFSAEEITTAKNLLFDSVPTTTRNISRRRKDGKSQKELDDIISLMKGTDPEKIPIFVARDLHKLPPVSFDHVDVTRLLKDIVLLQNEMKNMQARMDGFAPMTQLQQISQEMENIKNVNIAANTEYLRNVTSSTGTVQTQNSYIIPERGPSTLIPTEETQIPQRLSTCSRSDICDTEVSIVTDEEEVSRDTPSGQMQACKVTEPECVTLETSTLNSQKTRCRSFAQAVKDIQRDGTKNQEDEWTVVHRKPPKTSKYRFRGMVGTAEQNPDEIFKAADRQIPLYLYEVNKEASIEHVADYIMRKTNLAVQPIQVKMRREKNYNSYKFWIPKSKLSMFLDDNMWPRGIYFRRYIYTKHQDVDTNRPSKENKTSTS